MVWFNWELGWLYVLSTNQLKESPGLQEKAYHSLPQWFGNLEKKEDYLEVRNLVEIQVDMGQLDLGKFIYFLHICSHPLLPIPPPQKSFNKVKYVN